MSDGREGARFFEKVERNYYPEVRVEQLSLNCSKRLVHLVQLSVR